MRRNRRRRWRGGGRQGERREDDKIGCSCVVWWREDVGGCKAWQWGGGEAVGGEDMGLGRVGMRWEGVVTVKAKCLAGRA